MKRVAIFGGTFDPIHHGHLILARETVEALQLDRLIFVPAAISPHKLDWKVSAAAARVEMLRAAIESEPKFQLDEMELERPPPSYSIDTVEALRLREQAAEFFYLVGEDNVSGLRTWHRFDELSKMVQFVVLERSGIETTHSYPVIQRHLDISATEIRNRVASGRSIRYLVPAAVENIIHERQLYREPEK
ncbi:MAG TPA: nicotinate-nucleotide adenylyltransferase [Chthoniobacterales bacterium]